MSRAHLAAREGALELEAAFTTLRSDRVDGMIAELAAALVDDAPCPVCGAIEHPDPSEVRGRPVSRADEEAAALASEEAHERARLLGERLAAAQAARGGAVERLRELGCDGVELEALHAHHQECCAEVERLSRGVGRSGGGGGRAGGGRARVEPASRCAGPVAGGRDGGAPAGSRRCRAPTRARRPAGGTARWRSGCCDGTAIGLRPRSIR